MRIVDGGVYVGMPGHTYGHSHTHTRTVAVKLATIEDIVLSAEVDFFCVWLKPGRMSMPQSTPSVSAVVAAAVAGVGCLFYNLFTLFPWGQIKNEEILITACQGFACVHSAGQAAP